ncbi:unnamed protein product [Umbelopsis vinacea]
MTTEPTSSSTQKEYYDADYFDSDEDIDNEELAMSIDKSEDTDRRKKREVPSNDNLLYNPEEDDVNEDWVAEQLRAIAPSAKGTPAKRSMAKTDAILSCPLCFTPVCLSCQRHETYPNQYRAMFVTNCRPNFSERFRYREPKDDTSSPSEADEAYYPGLQKAVSRLPHQILSKKAEVTRDPEFMELERQLKELTRHTERLQADAETYRDGVAAMLNHQASFSDYLSILYQPLDAELEDGVVRRRNNQTSAKAVQAVQDYATIMSYSRDELMPWLDVIDSQIIARTLQFREILKSVDKTITKRNHKLVDYDRFRTGLAKLKSKPERTLSEEKQMFKMEGQLDIATQDYEYLNGLLKEELPRILQLKSQVVDPMFQNFYFIQCRIYAMLLARMQEVISTNGAYFQTLNMGIEEGFNERSRQLNVRSELEESALLKQGGRAWLGASAANSSRLTLKERAAIRQEEKAQSSSPKVGGGYRSESPPPPAYASDHGQSLASSPYQGEAKQSASNTNDTYSPPAGHSKSPSGHSYVTALYDYAAQAEGDLSFSKGDRIELVQKTDDVNDWWTGRYNGVTGVFPGNYVTEN